MFIKSCNGCFLGAWSTARVVKCFPCEREDLNSIPKYEEKGQALCMGLWSWGNRDMWVPGTYDELMSCKYRWENPCFKKIKKESECLLRKQIQGWTLASTPCIRRCTPTQHRHPQTHSKRTLGWSYHWLSREFYWHFWEPGSVCVQISEISYDFSFFLFSLTGFLAKPSIRSWEVGPLLAYKMKYIPATVWNIQGSKNRTNKQNPSELPLPLWTTKISELPISGWLYPIGSIQVHEGSDLGGTHFE